MNSISEILANHRLIPIVVIEQLEHALPLAQALSQGGIQIMEITLRSDCALEAIQLIRQAMPQMLIGAGTVVKPEQVVLACQAGAQFLVSPGLNIELVKAAANVAYLPGVCQPSEIMNAMAMGFQHLKFYPFAFSGGQAYLQEMTKLFPQIQFCPTGGINQHNFHTCLQLANVFAVGGSWLANKQLIQQAQWPQITDIAQSSLSLF